MQVKEIELIVCEVLKETPQGQTFSAIAHEVALELEKGDNKETDYLNQQLRSSREDQLRLEELNEAFAHEIELLRKLLTMTWS